MRQFKDVPAIIMLLAGFITSVIMILREYPLVTFLWTLVAVMVTFYVISVLACRGLDRFFREEEKKESEEEESEEENSAENAENGENKE